MKNPVTHGRMYKVTGGGPVVPVFRQDRSPLPHRHSVQWRGVGQSTTQLAEQATSLATTAATVGAMIASASSVIPLIGIAGAIAGVLIAVLGQVFSGCGQSCVLTSAAANQIEEILRQNVDAYINSSNRTKSEQAAFLENFDNTWSKLVQYCGNPSFGTAGQRCTQDREEGACQWKTSPGGWDASTCTYTFPGANGSGTTCWNWFLGYRDPIANDPCVVPDASAPVTPSGASPFQVAQGVNQIWGTISSNPLPLLLIGGLILLAVFL